MTDSALENTVGAKAPKIGWGNFQGNVNIFDSIGDETLHL